MVAHNATDVHLLFAVMVRRRTFFQVILRSCFSRWGCHRATQQSRGGAMLRGGSFDHSGATFLGVNVIAVQRQNCECFLAAERLSTKRGHMMARLVKTSLNLLPSPCQAIRVWSREGRWI